MQTLSSVPNDFILISALFKKMNKRTQCAKLSQENELDKRLSAPDDTRLNSIRRDFDKNKN